ncbi:hypothetical protein K435DRAFT_237028 [Dendrothele bispora CBS 962.96]|uniref:Uncharacterized protein n=1 Tax=Dendrothele bispora (strain CBS 962.96) TaxID=1314807 RepID=A0A4S8LPF7_DENBC|nr:hypothetical protein K435DRAFT_237028 [Dendrothele bispora CBS 962.96]
MIPADMVDSVVYRINGMFFSLPNIRVSFFPLLPITVYLTLQLQPGTTSPTLPSAARTVSNLSGVSAVLSIFLLSASPSHFQNRSGHCQIRCPLTL